MEWCCSVVSLLKKELCFYKSATFGTVSRLPSLYCSSVHYLYLFFYCRSQLELEPISSDFEQEAGYTGLFIDSSHTHQWVKFRVANWPILHVFGMWEKTEHSEEAHTNTQTTGKVHTEKHPAGLWIEVGAFLLGDDFSIMLSFEEWPGYGSPVNS